MPKRPLAVTLDSAPLHALRFQLHADEPLEKHVCELVDRYETTIDETKPRRTRMTIRNVLDTEGWKAFHLPLCPEPGDHQRLPNEDIDCVACALDFDVGRLNYACYVLRVQAKRELIVAELYIASAPKLLGMVLMQFKNFGHILLSLSEDYRQKNPLGPSAVDREEAKERGQRILHFVENAMDLASAPLLELSARKSVGFHKEILQEPITLARPLEDAEGPVQGPKIKRRGGSG